MDNDTKKTFKYLFDHLTEDDRKLIELHHSSHIGEGIFEKCNGILDVLKLLHQRGVLNNRQQTLILLNTIGRKDLVKGLDKEISDSTHKFKVVKTCGGNVVLKSPVTIQNITEIIITQTEDPWEIKKIDPASYTLTGTNHDVVELTLPNRKKCYALNVLANGPDGKQINVVCDNLAIYYEAECGFITHDDNDFLLIAHNNGTPENVHFFQPPKDVKTDDSPCQRVLKGATKAAKTIGEFKEMARDLFKDNDYVFRFPPSNESTNDSINTFVDSLEKLPLFKETRFFIGYDIIEHLKLFQLFEERSCSVNFENLLFFLNPKDGVFGVLKYVDSREESILQTALDECNTVLNSCLALYGELFKRTYMLLYGGVVAPNISRVDLKESSYRCLNEDYSDLDNRRNVVFITKEDLESPTKLKSWWNRVKKIFRQERKDRGVGSKMDVIKEFNDISSQIVAVMSLHHQSLPRMTKDVKDRVTNLLLNKDQLKILQTRQSRFKVIEGPFGSGKSLVLKALAKKLHHESNNGQIFYICWDPYSLIEAEVHNNFETLKNNEHIDGANLICLNFKELSEVIDDFKIEELLQSFGTIKEPLNKFLAYCRTDDGPVHLLIDEFPGVNVDSKVCEEIKHHLTEIDNRSTLVIALQSTDKSYEIRSRATDFPVPKENLTKAGLKTFKLTKSMRMCHNLYQLIQIAQKEVVDSNLPIAAEDNISTSRRRRNFSGSLSTNTREDLLTSSQTEENSEHSSGFGSYETNTPLQSPPSSDQDKTPMKANVGKIHEPEVVLKTLFDSLKRQPSKSLRTKYKYPRGASGHDINSHCKPQILHLPEEFDYNLESICLLGAVFDRICLDENHHCTIICNDKQEFSMVKKALRTLGKDYVDYADYLKGLLPDRKRKLDVMQKLSEDSFILVTDYRSFRGCETDHCVTFVRPEESYTDHVLIEILTRAITKIDLIVYPQTAAQPDANTVNDSLSKVLNAWKGYPDLVSTRICGAFSLDRQTNQMDFKIDEEEHKVPLEEVVWDETMLEPTLDDNSGIRHLKQAVDKVICGAEQTNRKGDQLVECVSDVSMQTPNQPNKISRKRRSEEAAEASAEKKAKMQTNEKMEELKSKRIDLDEKKSYAFERTINIGAWSGFAKIFLPPDIERFSDEKSLDFVNFIATFEQALKIIKCGLNVSYDGVSVINCSEMNRDEFRDLRLLPLYPSSGIPLAFSSDGNVSYASQLDAGFNISLLNAYYVDFVEFRNQMNVHVLLTTKRYENLAPVDLEDAKGAIFKKDNKYYYNTQWNAKFITVKLLTDAQIPYSTASFVRPTSLPKEIIDCKETPKFQPVFLDHTLGCLFFTYLEYESQSSNGKIRFLPFDESLKSQFLDEINKISIDDKDDTSDTSEQSDQLINQLQMPRTFRTGVSIDNEDIHVLKCLVNAFATNSSVPQPHLCIRRILEILTGYVKSSNTFKNSLPVSKTVLVFANQFNVRLGMAIRKQIRDFVFRIHGK